MLRTRCLASLLVIITVGGSAPAWAAGTPTDRERAQLARQAYEGGKKAYNLGDFDKSIELWKQAYEYRDDPIFLFNIGQAYRQKADYQKAIFFYKAYTREEPRARNRPEVEARIVELQKLLDAQPPPPEPPQSRAVEPPVPTPESRPVVPPIATSPPPHDDEVEPIAHPGRSYKVAAWVTGGVGVGALIAGIVFSLRAQSIQGDIETAAQSGMPWSAELVDQEADGRTSATLGLVGIGVGAAAIAGAATLYYLGVRKDAAAMREAQSWIVPSLQPNGGGVVWVRQF